LFAFSELAFSAQDEKPTLVLRRTGALFEQLQLTLLKTLAGTFYYQLKTLVGICFRAGNKNNCFFSKKIIKRRTVLL
jgi:hypothetical protein